VVERPLALLAGWAPSSRDEKVARGVLNAIIFLAILVAVLGLLHHYEILARAIAVLGLGLLVAMIVIAAVAGVVMLIAIPYFLIKKKPKVEAGSYRLEEEKGKGE
jgi:hypothetical protein